MYYAWNTAADFATGARPLTRGTTEESVSQKMRRHNHRSFLTAFRVDGAWVDLTVYDSAAKRDGRLVSEERSHRYIRSRARKLAEQRIREVRQEDTFLYSDGQTAGDQNEGSVPEPTFPAPEQREPDPEPQPLPPSEEVVRDKILLSVDPVVVKALFEFIALDKETREIAINALAALSISSDPFKSAIEVMLDDTKELTVGLSVPKPPEEQNPQS